MISYMRSELMRSLEVSCQCTRLFYEWDESKIVNIRLAVNICSIFLLIIFWWTRISCRQPISSSIKSDPSDFQWTSWTNRLQTWIPDASTYSFTKGSQSYPPRVKLNDFTPNIASMVALNSSKTSVLVHHYHRFLQHLIQEKDWFLTW